MTLAIVLSSERFATNAANERSLVGVRTKMRAKVVGSSESLCAKVTREDGRMLLYTSIGVAAGGLLTNEVLSNRSIRRRTTWVCHLKDALSVWA